jgi:hypothetical protein
MISAVSPAGGMISEAAAEPHGTKKHTKQASIGAIVIILMVAPPLFTVQVATSRLGKPRTSAVIASGKRKHHAPAGVIAAYKAENPWPVST